MAQQNTGSLIGRAFMIILAVFIALVAVSLVVALLKMLAGLLFVVGVIVGAMYVYRRLRG
jgi:predicted permease